MILTNTGSTKRLSNRKSSNESPAMKRQRRQQPPPPPPTTTTTRTRTRTTRQQQQNMQDSTTRIATTTRRLGTKTVDRKKRCYILPRTTVHMIAIAVRFDMEVATHEDHCSDACLGHASTNQADFPLQHNGTSHATDLACLHGWL